MSISQDIQRAVLDKPGMTMRQTAEAIGRGDRAGVQGVSAQMSQLCKAGKLRKDSVYALTGVPRYWPTDSTLTDGRETRYTAIRKPPRPVAAKPAPPRKQVAQVIRAPIKAAPPSAPKPVPKPTPKQQPRCLRPLIRPRPMPNGDAETVEQYQARGGVIERLPPSATSTPLRHTYSEMEAMQ